MIIQWFSVLLCHTVSRRLFELFFKTDFKKQRQKATEKVKTRTVVCILPYQRRRQAHISFDLELFLASFKGYLQLVFKLSAIL